MLSYSPMKLDEFFNERLRDFYPIPPGIHVQFRDKHLGSGLPPCWSIVITNINHETEWAPPWGSLRSQDFARVVRIILLEVEPRFGIKFPRENENGQDGQPRKDSP